jgi:hypothetical protein
MIAMAEFGIINGPDKWTLASSFFDRRPIKLLGIDDSVEGIMLKIEHEDGSKESFNIDLLSNGKTYRVYYKTSEKKGIARLIEN